VHNTVFGESKWHSKPVTPEAVAKAASDLKQRKAPDVPEIRDRKKIHALFACICIVLLLALSAGCARRQGMGAAAGAKPIQELYAGKVVLIVNGDDVGITQIFTDATIDAYLKGKISSASIVAPGHDAERAIQILKSHPELPIGVHLTLTGDWKPLTSGAGLHGASGLMWNTAEEAGAHVRPEEAQAEWDAQIRKIVDAGVTVSHLDGHMGCYFLSPQLFTAAFALARKYRVPLISPYLPGQMPADVKKFFPLSSYTGIYTLAGGVKETPENRAEAYWKMLGELAPGIHYIYSHHGWEPPDEAITGDLGLRIDDNKFWTADETGERLAGKGCVVIGCTPLKEDFQAALSN
jgi:hypothetical protein